MLKFVQEQCKILWKRKNENGIWQKKYNSEKSAVSSVKRCRKELKLLIKRAEVKEISEYEKSRYFELCKQIVKMEKD